MNRPTPTELICIPLPKFDLEDWPTIHGLFAPLPAWKLQQAWLRRPAPELAGGLFQAGCWSDALVVYAVLHDRDIYNPVTEFNDVALTRGDAFEMFLRPEGQEAYYEFHVTPHNQRLQLRFESAEAFASLARRAGKRSLASGKVHRPLFESCTHIDGAAQRWHVVAAIPFVSVVETEVARTLMRWRFSASRYDYTRGVPKPVLSSTPPHAFCNFHRQEEWGTLALAPHSITAAQGTLAPVLGEGAA